MVVEKALEKDPAERYQSMRELVVDLRRLSRQKVSDAPAAAVAPNVRRGCHGRWRRCCVELRSMDLHSPHRTVLENPLSGAEFTRLTDFEGAQTNPAISPDGKFVAFISDRSGTFEIWLSQANGGSLSNLPRAAWEM